MHLKNTKNDAVQLCLPDIGVTAAWELNEFGEKILLSGKCILLIEDLWKTISNCAYDSNYLTIIHNVYCV